MRRLGLFSIARRVALITAVTCLGACAGSARRALEEDRIARLKSDIGKVGFAIRTTKTLLARARGASYLPDLQSRLAELYIEQARYYYQLALEQTKDKGGGVVSVQARLLKNQAIATYRRLLSLFPEYPDADKVLFFMAHEMRELGEYPEMLKTYQELADKHPKSVFRLEGLLVMGDYYFDKAQLEEAEKYYNMVLQGSETRVHAMARYKLAWCKVNRADFKAALKLFEGSIAAAKKFLGDKGTRGSGGEQIDLRREALVDSVFSYTEVYKPKDALPYFKERADSKTTYLAALRKLGNRYYVRQDRAAAAAVYREILSLTGDSEDSLEEAHRLYESVAEGKLYEQGAQDVEGFIRVVRRRYYNSALADKERKKLYDTFETYSRYIATKLHDLANEKREQELYEQAAEAYRAYLDFYGQSKHAPAIRANLAEALYAAKSFFEAGRYYELAAEGKKGGARAESTYTAAVAYFASLKSPEGLSRLEVVQARAGLRRVGRSYIRENPRGTNIKEVKFNIARTYYDSGEFDEAVRLFTALIEQFPQSKEAPVAAHLVLDSYRNKEDYEGLINAGKVFGRISALGDAQFKQEVAEIVRGAEENLLRAETIKAGDDDGEGTDKLEQIAEKYKGTALGLKALLNAFVTARNSKDPERVFEVGEKLRRAYPSAKELPDVLSTMGKIALDSLQFARGAAYVEAAARYKDGSEATELYKVAGTIRARLGERQAAEADLNVLLRTGTAPAEKAQLALTVAQLHVEANDWDAVVSLLQRASAAGASSAQLSYLLGYALFRQGQLASAQPHLEQAIEAGRDGNDQERQAAAAAQFYLVEIAYKAFEAVELSSDLSQLGATLQQKLGFMAQTRQAYTGVGGFGSATWTVAALGRLAAVDQNAAASLRGLRMPSGIPEEAVQQVRDALEAQAKPLEDESKQALAQCAAAALRLKVLSEAARACLGGTAPSGDPQAKIVSVSVNRSAPAGAKKLQRQLASRPNDLEAIEQLGRLYLKNGDPYMARMILGKGLELKENAPLLTMVAVCTASLGDYQEALSLLDQALKLDPGYPQARVNKAALLAKFGYGALAKAERSRVRNLSALGSDDPALLPDALSTLGVGGGRR